MKLEMSPEVLYAQYKNIQNLTFDTVVGFQDPTTTAREANVNRMMQFRAIGVPVPLEQIVEASDVPYKEEMQAALKTQGEQPVNADLLKAVTAMQGQGTDGVNTSQ